METARFEDKGICFIDKRLTVIAGLEDRAEATAAEIEAAALAAKTEAELPQTKRYNRGLLLANYRRAMKDVQKIREQIAATK